MNDMIKHPISKYLLEELLPESLMSTPAVAISEAETVRGAVCLLQHHLETFTDSLVVTSNEDPVGIIGGSEVLYGVLNNPTVDFFDKTTVRKITNKEKLIIIKSTNKLSELIERWSQTRRAFAIIPNQYHGYSVVSARKLLEVAIKCKTDLSISSLSKEMKTFNEKNTVGEIINSMFENNTRKLILEGTSSFISDRIIMQALARDLDCLHGREDFLDMNSSIFKLDQAKKVSGDLKINEAAKIMYNMQSPYLLVNQRIVTPWDIVTILGSEKLLEYGQ